MRLATYLEAAKAYNAIPEADKAVRRAEAGGEGGPGRLVERRGRHAHRQRRRLRRLRPAKNLAPAARDKVNQMLESTYKGRFPEDATLAGLQKLLQEKGAALGLAPASPAPAPAPGN